MQIDREEIIRAAKLLVAPGGITELRALDALLRGSRYAGTASGYFSSAAALADAAASIDKALGIYIIPNVVDPSLLARAENRIRIVKSEPITADKDIKARRWLLIDLDAVRAKGISSTDVEHATALNRAAQIRDHLDESGWPAPVEGDSGNGAHLLYRVDLGNDDGGLIQRCLKALAAKFDDAATTVDTSVYNPARIWKLYGTIACKGDSTTDRPHRMARLVRVPEVLEVVSLELLLALGGVEKKEQTKTYASAGDFDLEAWVNRHLPDAVGPKEKSGGGQFWAIPICPFNQEHDDSAAFVGRRKEGAIVAGCMHDSCDGKWNWHWLREKYEPAAQRNGKHKKKSEPDEHYVSRLVTINARAVVRKRINWLWYHRFAIGKLSLVAGDPNQGKSLITMDIAARISRGEPFPDSTAVPVERGRVLVFSGEDDAEDTICPRLDAADADSNRIEIATSVRCGQRDEDSSESMFDMAKDLPAVERFLETGDFRMLIIDPVSAYLGDTDSHKNAEIRGLLLPLSRMSAQYSISTLMVTHLRKSGDGPAVHRASGSLAFAAAARAVFGCCRDKDDEDGVRRLFLPIKNNIAPDRSGLAYHIEPWVKDPDWARVEWQEGIVETSADDAMSGKPGPDPVKRKEAEGFLRQHLTGKSMDVHDLEALALREGINEHTLRRARTALGIVSWKVGGGYKCGFPLKTETDIPA